ncbi:hypothetical protein ACJ6WF_24805 [Streptomyces sp. MMS24-I2-30]|uniref:hypothetical protein n=1 Tax=Streptomyces sp. MMS24-I2-30 TaxID=3351564 RepID=UPI003896E1C8
MPAPARTCHFARTDRIHADTAVQAHPEFTCDASHFYPVGKAIRTTGAEAAFRWAQKR